MLLLQNVVLPHSLLSESTICYLHLAPEGQSLIPGRVSACVVLACTSRSRLRARPLCLSSSPTMFNCLTPFCLKASVHVQTDQEALPTHTKQCSSFTRLVVPGKTRKGLCGEHMIYFALKCFQHLKIKQSIQQQFSHLLNINQLNDR